MIQSDQTKVYAYLTLSYWLFMLTDGALRMLVLLHFHLMGLGAIQIAYLFVIYEIAGVITNLLAGWIASKFGLALILYIGLLFQIGVILTLTNLSLIHI